MQFLINSLQPISHSFVFMFPAGRVMKMYRHKCLKKTNSKVICMSNHRNSILTWHMQVFFARIPLALYIKKCSLDFRCFRSIHTVKNLKRHEIIMLRQQMPLRKSPFAPGYSVRKNDTKCTIKTVHQELFNPLSTYYQNHYYFILHFTDGTKPFSLNVDLNFPNTWGCLQAGIWLHLLWVPHPLLSMGVSEHWIGPIVTVLDLYPDLFICSLF